MTRPKQHAAKRAGQRRRRQDAAEVVEARAERFEHDDAPGDDGATLNPTVDKKELDADLRRRKGAGRRTTGDLRFLDGEQRKNGGDLDRAGCAECEPRTEIGQHDAAGSRTDHVGERTRAPRARRSACRDDRCRRASRRRRDSRSSRRPAISTTSTQNINQRQARCPCTSAMAGNGKAPSAVPSTSVRRNPIAEATTMTTRTQRRTAARGSRRRRERFAAAAARR